MDTSAIRSLLSKLDYDWFEKKRFFFSKEGLYDKIKKKIHESFEDIDYDDEEKKREIVVDIDLNRYCWNSFFYGSMSYGIDSDNIPQDFPIDSRDVADEIIRFVNNKVEKFTDVTAIDTVIRTVVDAVINEVDSFKKKTSDIEYCKALDYFVVNTRKEISAEFQHIKEQLRLRKQSGSIDRKLTPEICVKIANFRLDNKKFITSVEGELTEGDALFHLLNPGSNEKTKIKIRIEDWQDQDVYYLLHRILDIITSGPSIASIEKKRSLFLKKELLFQRNKYDTFKNQKLAGYSTLHPDRISSIDEQLAALFP